MERKAWSQILVSVSNFFALDFSTIARLRWEINRFSYSFFLKEEEEFIGWEINTTMIEQSHRQHKENSEYFSTFLRWTSINLSSIHLRFLALITISRNPSKFHDIITVYLTRELNSFEFEWYDLSIDVTHQSYRWRHNCHRLISTAIGNSKKKKTALQISFLFVIE